jgi:hypothetical protein
MSSLALVDPVVLESDPEDELRQVFNPVTGRAIWVDGSLTDDEVDWNLEEREARIQEEELRLAYKPPSMEIVGLLSALISESVFIPNEPSIINKENRMDDQMYDNLDPEIDLPRIWAGNQELPVVTKQAWIAVKDANDPEKYFSYLGRVTRLSNGEIQELTPDRFRHELARLAEWFYYDRKEPKKENPAMPPMSVIRDMIAAPSYPLPILDRIVYTPVFAPDGTLSTVPGYHEAARTYYVSNGIQLPDHLPSIDNALELINELFIDFPFADDGPHKEGEAAHSASYANTIALLLLPFMRCLFDGLTPLHIASAATPGTGKGLLINTCLDIGTNGHYMVLSETRDDDEMRKRLTSLFLQGISAFNLDNLNKKIDSAVLAMALTSKEWSDRRLGGNETVTVENRAVWTATGNNPQMSTEMARRSVLIRLIAKQDKPWTRTDFRHPHLALWVNENRAALVAACLSIISSWIEAGRPKAKECPALGSFDEYVSTMGGILEHAGIHGFLGNHVQFIEETDTYGAAIRFLIESWRNKYPGKLVNGNFIDEPVTVKDLLPLALEIPEIDLDQKTERGQATAFGALLRKLKDTVIGPYTILSAPNVGHAAAYRLKYNGPEK